MYKIAAWVFLGIGIVLAAVTGILINVYEISISRSFQPHTDPEIAAMVLAILAVVMLILAACFAGVVAAYKRRENGLRAGGVKVEAAIDEVRAVLNVSTSTVQPYIIVCRWEHDGKVYIYRSEYLSFNPERYLADHGITTMTVYTDPYNPKRYYVDVNLFKNVVVA
jgi:hypothetical protein